MPPPALRAALLALLAALVLLTPGGAPAQRAGTTGADALKAKLDQGAKILVIDVRDEDEAQAGSIPGAINIPFDRLQQRTRDIPKDVTLVYKTTTSCPIRDWKAKGYALEPAKEPVAGALR